MLLNFGWSQFCISKSRTSFKRILARHSTDCGFYLPLWHPPACFTSPETRIEIQLMDLIIYNGLYRSVLTSRCLTQNHCHFVKYKSSENLSSNKFQVIVFEKIVKKCLKVNRFSLMFRNLFFQFKIMIMYFQNLWYLEIKLQVLLCFYYFLKP